MMLNIKTYKEELLKILNNSVIRINNQQNYKWIRGYITDEFVQFKDSDTSNVIHEALMKDFCDVVMVIQDDKISIIGEIFLQDSNLSKTLVDNVNDLDRWSNKIEKELDCQKILDALRELNRNSNRTISKLYDYTLAPDIILLEISGIDMINKKNNNTVDINEFKECMGLLSFKYIKCLTGNEYINNSKPVAFVNLDEKTYSVMYMDENRFKDTIFLLNGTDNDKSISSLSTKPSNFLVEIFKNKYNSKYLDNIEVKPKIFNDLTCDGLQFVGNSSDNVKYTFTIYEE